jgi:probable rRNA maturation factor
MNNIDVIGLTKQAKKFEKPIQKIAVKILKILKKTNVSVEIYLIDNQKMRFLNKKFRGQDKITTILSFEEPRNFVLPPSKARKIGEIYLNMSKVKGKMSNVHLLSHGLLHLLGYKHGNKSDRIRMESKEQKLLKLLMTNS